MQFTTRLLVIAFSLSTALAGPGRAIDLDSLFAVSVGGKSAADSVRNLKSIVTEGTALIGGLQGRFRQYIVFPDRVFLEINSATFKMTQGYDGVTGWQRDANGQVSELTGFEKELLRKNLYLATYAYMSPSRVGRPPAYRGTEEQAGVKYQVVGLVPTEGDTIVACFNATTGRCEMVGTQADNLYAVTSSEDFRSVSGIQMAFHTVDTVIGLPVSAQMTVEKAEINVPVDSAIFLMPSNRAADFAFPAGQKSVSIRFAYTRGHIRVPVVVNGWKKMRLILDSGASGNVFHRGAIAVMKLPISGYLPARGVSGNDSIALVKIDSIRVGELTLYNQVAGMLDLSSLARGDDRPEEFGGLLGYDFLSRFPVQVNYQDSTITVFNPEGFVPPVGGVEIPFRLTQSVPTISATLDGIPGEFIVDLGNATGLIVHAPFFASHHLDTVLTDFQPLPHDITGLGGALGGQSAYARDFDIGGVHLGDLRVIVPSGSAGLTGLLEVAGNIGSPILEHFSVLFDYQQKRIILFPTILQKQIRIEVDPVGQLADLFPI